MNYSSITIIIFLSYFNFKHNFISILFIISILLKNLCLQHLKIVFKYKFLLFFYSKAKELCMNFRPNPTTVYMGQEPEKPIVVEKFFEALIESLEKPKLETVLKNPTPPLELDNPNTGFGTQVEPTTFFTPNTISNQPIYNQSISDQHLDPNNGNLIDNRGALAPEVFAGLPINILQHAPIIFGGCLVGALIIHELVRGYTSHIGSNNEGSSSIGSSSNTTSSSSSGQSSQQSTGQSSGSGRSRGLASGIGGSGDGDDDDPEKWSRLADPDFIAGLTAEEMKLLILDLVQKNEPRNLSQAQINWIVHQVRRLQQTCDILDGYNVQLMNLQIYKNRGTSSVLVVSELNGRSSFFINLNSRRMSNYSVVVDDNIINTITSVLNNDNAASLLGTEPSLASVAESEGVSATSCIKRQMPGEREVLAANPAPVQTGVTIEPVQPQAAPVTQAPQVAAPVALLEPIMSHQEASAIMSHPGISAVLAKQAAGLLFQQGYGPFMQQYPGNVIPYPSLQQMQLQQQQMQLQQQQFPLAPPNENQAVAGTTVNINNNQAALATNETAQLATNKTAQLATNKTAQDQLVDADTSADNNNIEIITPPPNNNGSGPINNPWLQGLAGVLVALGVILQINNNTGKKQKHFDLGKIRGGQNFNDSLANQNRENNPFGKFSFLFSPFSNTTNFPLPRTDNQYLESQSAVIEGTNEFISGESAGFSAAHQKYSKLHPRFRNDLPRLERDSGNSRPSGRGATDVGAAGAVGAAAVTIVRVLLKICKDLGKKK